MRAIASVKKSLDAHVGTGLYPVVAAALTHARIAEVAAFAQLHAAVPQVHVSFDTVVGWDGAGKLADSKADAARQSENSGSLSA